MGKEIKEHLLEKIIIFFNVSSLDNLVAHFYLFCRKTMRQMDWQQRDRDKRDRETERQKDRKTKDKKTKRQKDRKT